MQKSSNHSIQYQTTPRLLPCWFFRRHGKRLGMLMLVGTLLLSGCGGGNKGSIGSGTLSGNWQFTMAPPPDGSFLGGLEGGFLLQDAGSVKGSVAYSVSLPPSSNQTACNSGSAAVTGMVSGQSVTLTAVAGTQTFTLTGTLSFDGFTMGGTYTSTAGTAPGGSGCGTPQAGLQWSASLVPALSGSVGG